MKKIKWFTLFLTFIVTYMPMTILASSGSTDVYIGVTTVSKSNMKFLIIDEAGVPIDGASIELWANDKLGYQLLGVSHTQGIFETALPYGTYKYRVYAVGYEEVKQNVNLPNRENPHVEKVVLKKKKPAVPGEKEPAPDVDTGDGTNMWLYVIMLGISFMILCTYNLKKNSKG